MIPLFKTFKCESGPLIKELICGLGILSAEKKVYADQFLNQNGIAVVIKVYQEFTDYSDDNLEIESAVTYALTSPVFDESRDYMQIREIIPFLLDILYRR